MEIKIKYKEFDIILTHLPNINDDTSYRVRLELKTWLNLNGPSPQTIDEKSMEAFYKPAIEAAAKTCLKELLEE